MNATKKIKNYLWLFDERCDYAAVLLSLQAQQMLKA